MRENMKSPVVKRSIVINGHKTSISIEDQFWAAAKEIAAERHLSLSELVSMVDHERQHLGNLSSALRVFVLSRYRSASTTAPHDVAQDRVAKPTAP